MVIFLFNCYIYMKKKEKKILFYTFALTRNIKCLILALNWSRLFKHVHQHLDISLMSWTAIALVCSDFIRSTSTVYFDLSNAFLNRYFLHLFREFAIELKPVVIVMLQMIGSLHISNYIWAVRSLFVNYFQKVDMYKSFFFFEHQNKQTSNEWKDILAKRRTPKVICWY